MESFNEKKETGKEKIGKRGMKLVRVDGFTEGFPICNDCLRDIHKQHSMSSEEKFDDRTIDCKNIDYIDGVVRQCFCGMGGNYKNGKWESWNDDE